MHDTKDAGQEVGRSGSRQARKDEGQEEGRSGRKQVRK